MSPTTSPKFETSPRDTGGHENHLALFKVGNEGEAFIAANAAVKKAATSAKAIDAFSIQLFDQLFEALSATFSVLTMRILEQQCQ